VTRDDDDEDDDDDDDDNNNNNNNNNNNLQVNKVHKIKATIASSFCIDR
jgi:hypothetical protein